MKTITRKQYVELSYKERDNFTGIIKHDNGKIQYVKNDKNHRDYKEGPAVICKNFLYYFFEGLYHRLDGPAVIVLKKTKNLSDSYWIYGQNFNEKDYWKHPEVIKNSKEFQYFLKYKETT